MVLMCAEDAGVDSLGVERMGQHGFPCVLWHPPPRRREAAVLRRPLVGLWDQALEPGLCPGQIWQLPELRMGPALTPRSIGGGVGLGGCGGVMGTGGRGGPRRFFVVLCRGCAWGAGAWADVDPWVRAHRLRLRVGFGFTVAVVAGHLLDVG